MVIMFVITFRNVRWKTYNGMNELMNEWLNGLMNEWLNENPLRSHKKL